MIVIFRGSLLPALTEELSFVDVAISPSNCCAIRESLINPARRNDGRKKKLSYSKSRQDIVEVTGFPGILRTQCLSWIPVNLVVTRTYRTGPSKQMSKCIYDMLSMGACTQLSLSSRIDLVSTRIGNGTKSERCTDGCIRTLLPVATCYFVPGTPTTIVHKVVTF